MGVIFQLQLGAETPRDELQLSGGDGGGASPLTARSLRLERVAQALAHSQEELRRYGAHFIHYYYEIYIAVLVKY